MDLDYSPTGKEFVTGSYDKTVRTFGSEQGRSSLAYHTKRMQKVMAVCWSQDCQYLFSGSEDMNIRLWKARADQPNRPMGEREKTKLQYRDKLVDRYKSNDQVRRILKTHLPSYVKNAHKKREIMKDSKRRKRHNMEVNNPGDYEAPRPEKVGKVVATLN
jgi:DDB1- and CUL4-associated factor 13